MIKNYWHKKTTKVFKNQISPEGLDCRQNGTSMIKFLNVRESVP